MATALEPQVIEDQASHPSGTPGLVRVAWRYKFLIVLGLAVGLVAGWLMAGKQPVFYRSSAQVLVIKKTADPGLGADGRPSVVEDYLATQQLLICSPKIVRSAVTEHKLNELPSFQGADPTGAIIGNLKVTREMGDMRGGSNVLTLTYTGSTSEDCVVVIEAIIDSYIKFLNKQYQSDTNEAAKIIKTANNTLKKGIEEKQGELNKLVKDFPELWRPREGQSVAFDRYQRLKDRVELLGYEQEDIRIKLLMLDTVQEETRKQQAIIVLSAGTALAAAAPDNLERLATEYLAGVSTQDKQRIDELNMEYLKLKRLEKKHLENGWGPNSDQVKAVRADMRQLEEDIKLLQSSGGPLLDKRINVADYCKFELQRRAENKRTEVKFLADPLRDAETKLKAQKELEIKESTLKKSIDDEGKLFEKVVEQLHRVNRLPENNNGFQADTIAPPGPGAMIVPTGGRTVLMGAVLGLLAGCGLAYLAYLSDQSFRTPEEVRHRLGLPLIGHIPSFADRSTLVVADGPPVDPSVLTFHRSKSREAEAYRGVRTALFFSMRGGHKVIQITSPDMGDGKTTLAANLAVSIAQSEKRTILVDADLRRPRVAQLFGLDNERGLTSFLCGEAKVNEVIRESGVPGLHVLTTGPVPHNPSELLSLPRLHQLLHFLKANYDLVLVDTPPLLAVTDPCAVVPYVDGVLLTMRLSKRARPHATRAREILAGLEAPVLGVVINGVGRQGGSGYGYTSFNYGYGYADSYGYANYGGNDSYYTPDGAAPAGTATETMVNGNGTNGNGHDAGDGMAIRHVRKHRHEPRKGFFSWLFNR
jgi:capsular exopolysaccharide synthesis family protein